MSGRGILRVLFAEALAGDPISGQDRSGNPVYGNSFSVDRTLSANPFSGDRPLLERLGAALLWVGVLVIVMLFLSGCVSLDAGTADTETAGAEQETAQSPHTERRDESSGAHEQDMAGQDASPEEQTRSAVAGAEDMTAVEDVGADGLTPVYADSLREGSYPIGVKSSSSMFRIADCRLIVSGGQLSAILTLSSEAYSHLYAGSAREAAAADPADHIAPVENGGEGVWESGTAAYSKDALQSGLHAAQSGGENSGDDAARSGEEESGGVSFLLPVEALNVGVPCAAYSVRKGLWYDRTLLFQADTLPLKAFVSLTTAESLNLADGDYTAEVTLSGGSGRAGVDSPARLHVADGACRVELIWNSSHYDYMKVDGTIYPVLPEEQRPPESGDRSVFWIPVAAFDQPLAVVADTTAMSQPYEIAYTLYVDAATIQSVTEGASGQNGGVSGENENDTMSAPNGSESGESAAEGGAS